MLTPTLERAIVNGDAEYRTFVFGGSGVSTIPVPKNSFIIITDFDYFYFVDAPEGQGENPAISKNTLFSVDPTLVFTLQINIAPFGTTALITFDPADVPTTNLNLNFQLQTTFGAGWSGLAVYAGTFWQLTLTSSSPGSPYNTILPLLITVPLMATSTTPFMGGTDKSPVPIEELLKYKTHQLVFRSENAQNNFVIHEKLFIFDSALFGGQGYFINVDGYYHKDTFLMHKFPVRINIARVPDPSEWTVNYGILPAQSQEKDVPAGYGQAASVISMPAVKNINFGFGAENYIPNTADFSPAPPAGSYRPQFNPDIRPGRELNDPTLFTRQLGSVRTYPLVNVGYVLFNKNYTEYFTNG